MVLATYKITKSRSKCCLLLMEKMVALNRNTLTLLSTAKIAKRALSNNKNEKKIKKTSPEINDEALNE